MEGELLPKDSLRRKIADGIIDQLINVWKS
jgi:hypothetical protein